MEFSAERLLKTSFSVATMLVVVALSLLPLLTPITHLMLDGAGSAWRLYATSDQVYSWSDQTVNSLVWGLDTMNVTDSFGQSFYSPAELSHLQDVHHLLVIVLIAGGVGLLGLVAGFIWRPRSEMWAAVSRGGRWLTVTVLIIAVVALVGFKRTWHWFHQLFFTGGNYTFDSASDHLVQLYPTDFWMAFTATFGGFVLVLSAVAWYVGRSHDQSAAKIDTAAIA